MHTTGFDLFTVFWKNHHFIFNFIQTHSTRFPPQFKPIVSISRTVVYYHMISIIFSLVFYCHVYCQHHFDKYTDLFEFFLLGFLLFICLSTHTLSAHRFCSIFSLFLMTWPIISVTFNYFYMNFFMQLLQSMCDARLSTFFTMLIYSVWLFLLFASFYLFSGKSSWASSKIPKNKIRRTIVCQLQPKEMFISRKTKSSVFFNKFLQPLYLSLFVSNCSRYFIDAHQNHSVFFPFFKNIILFI